MGLDTARFFEVFRATKTWVARSVGIGGLGKIQTNPWSQHPGRPPLQSEGGAEQPAKGGVADPVHHCFVCGLAMADHARGEENS